MGQLLIYSIFLISTSVHAITLRQFGDCAQIANPIIASIISSQHRGINHFVAVHGQSMAIMGASKFVGSEFKFTASRRPSGIGYTGMPSGHTTSSWSSAAYVRKYGGTHQWLTVPLYASALLTGYSRIQSRQHTVSQVVAAIILSETINAQYTPPTKIMTSEVVFNNKKQLGLKLHLTF